MRLAGLSPRAAAGLLLCALAVPIVAAQDPPDQRSCRTDYVIRASLDAEDMVLTGELTMTWSNRTQDTVSDLWFHLYHNAFSNTLSTHVWEARGVLRRGQRLGRDEWGWQQVTSIVHEDSGADLTGTLTFRAPDDGREQDRTVFSVDLPEPVPPGGQARVTIQWESKIPRVRRRTGHKGDFLLMAHWFPKLGVYEGGRGWNCHQFHRDTEFYADFGAYDVTLDLPAEYDGKIGASGVQVGPAKRTDGRVEVNFMAPSLADQAYADPVTAGTTGMKPLVHGFAWTADPNYEVVTKTFRYEEWKQLHPEEVRLLAASLGRDESAVKLRDVEVQVMIQSERLAQAERHYEATCAALFFYGLWFGEYPYEKVTVVDPAWGASAAGGMEYPTLFTCGTQLYTEPAMFRPESVTVHEAGHQFWYALVGNNEFEAAWLDEGFNSYSDAETLYRHYGLRREATWYAGLPQWGTRAAPLPATGRIGRILTGRRWHVPSLFDRQPAFDLEPLALPAFVEWFRDQPRLTFVEERSDIRWGDRVGYLRDPDSDPIDTVAYEYVDRESYSTNSYPRTAAALRSISGVIGRDAFLRGMRHFSETWRYRHPYPADFYSTFNEGAGVDIGWYFDEVFRGTGTVDWSVDVEQKREPKEQGLVAQENGSYSLVGYDEDDEPPPRRDPLADGESDEDEDGDEEAAGRNRLYDVVVRRKGSLRLPVDIAVRFESGREELFSWTREMQADSTWWRFDLEPGTDRIAAVVVDPERLYYLDRDMSDNQWYAEREPLVPARWGERVFTQYSHLLQWISRTGG